MGEECLIQLAESLDELAQQLVQLSESCRNYTEPKPNKLRRRIPPNAYTVYFKEQQTQLKKTEPELAAPDMMRRIAPSWKTLAPEQRKEYITKATEKSRDFYKVLGNTPAVVRKPRCRHCYEAHRICIGATPCTRCAGLGIECENRVRKSRALVKS